MSEANALIRLIRAGSSTALLNLAEALEEGRVRLDSSSVGIASVPGVDEDLANQAARCFATIDRLDSRGLAVAIRAAVGIRDEEELQSPKVEVCWTGPDAEGPFVRPNAVAVRDMLASCSDNGTVLLVGYSMTVAKGSFMEEVLELLIEASKRHAKIQVVLHKDDESRNLAELLKNWDVFVRKPEVFTWEPPLDHPYTKLHAKCLVVDRLQLLVTSANFTFHGLESNIELGLLVRNQPLASAVHDRFQLLINDEVLRPWRDVA